jgi:polar amino acid transport system permease protein
VTGSSTGDAEPPGDRRERLALASARVPFRLKTAVVWVGIFAVLGGLFWLSEFDTDWMLDNFTFIATGLRYTILIAVGGIVLAVILAALGALGRLSSNPIAHGISGFYVSFFRGTPLLVQLFLVYLALPQVVGNLLARTAEPGGLPEISMEYQQYFILSTAVAGTIVLGLNYGAYMTEIFRAGIQSVAGGQGEAADALGMTHRQKMRKVVLPQAFRMIIPPTGNEFIAMMKDTAQVSVLGVTLENAEIFRRASLAGKADFKNLEAFVVAAGLYWALTVLFTFFQTRLERRVSRGYERLPADVGRSTGQAHGGMG